jgi:hypothetical protein
MHLETDTTQSGLPVEEVLRDALSSCGVVLAVIGRD